MLGLGLSITRAALPYNRELMVGKPITFDSTHATFDNTRITMDSTVYTRQMLLPQEVASP